MDALEVQEQLVRRFHLHHRAVLEHDALAEAHELYEMGLLMAKLRELIPVQRRGSQPGRRSTDVMPGCTSPRGPAGRTTQEDPWQPRSSS